MNEGMGEAVSAQVPPTHSGACRDPGQKRCIHEMISTALRPTNFMSLQAFHPDVRITASKRASVR